MSNEKKTQPVYMAAQLKENFVSLQNTHFLVLESELAAVGASIAAERAKQSSSKNLSGTHTASPFIKK